MSEAEDRCEDEVEVTFESDGNADEKTEPIKREKKKGIVWRTWQNHDVVQFGVDRNNRGIEGFDNKEVRGN